MGFRDNGISVNILDYEDFFGRFINYSVNKFEFLPNRIKDIWKVRYINTINKEYLRVYEEANPDIVFIYNNQNIHPEVLEKFSRKSKIVFFLGDNPLYTPTNIYNLQILFSADYIICPDTLWLDQLKKMGIKNIVFDCFGFNPEMYYPLNLTETEKRQYGSDLVYVGNAHKDNWGYKRFLFLNQFEKFNLKVFLSGSGYQKRWKSFFPELSKNIVQHNSYDQKFNNLVYNCSKIGPVELVPSLFNGVHVRVMDLLGAGIFPLCEYSSDLDRVFAGLDIPYIRHYDEASSLADYLLNNEEYRLSLIRQMRDRINSTYSPEKVISRMLASLNIQDIHV